MKIAFAFLTALAAWSVQAQEVYGTNGFRMYCQEKQIGKTGFTVASNQMETTGAEIKITAELKSATCQDGQVWALNNPWESYNFRVYNTETRTYDTVNVTSKDFKLNIVNPAGVKAVAASALGANETVGSVVFSVEEFLTDEQKAQLENGSIKLNIWVLVNAIHEFNSSSGTKVGPARYASARANLSVEVEKVNGQIVVKNQ